MFSQLNREVQHASDLVSTHRHCRMAGESKQSGGQAAVQAAQSDPSLDMASLLGISASLWLPTGVDIESQLKANQPPILFETLQNLFQCIEYVQTMQEDLRGGQVLLTLPASGLRVEVSGSTIKFCLQIGGLVHVPGSVNVQFACRWTATPMEPSITCAAASDCTRQSEEGLFPGFGKLVHVNFVVSWHHPGVEHTHSKMALANVVCVRDLAGCVLTYLLNRAALLPKVDGLLSTDPISVGIEGRQDPSTVNLTFLWDSPASVRDGSASLLKKTPQHLRAAVLFTLFESISSRSEIPNLDMSVDGSSLEGWSNFFRKVEFRVHSLFHGVGETNVRDIMTDFQSPDSEINQTKLKIWAQNISDFFLLGLSGGEGSPKTMNLSFGSVFVYALYGCTSHTRAKLLEMHPYSAPLEKSKKVRSGTFAQQKSVQTAQGWYAHLCEGASRVFSTFDKCSSKTWHIPVLSMSSCLETFLQRFPIVAATHVIQSADECRSGDLEERAKDEGLGVAVWNWIQPFRAMGINGKYGSPSLYTLFAKTLSTVLRTATIGSVLSSNGCLVKLMTMLNCNAKEEDVRHITNLVLADFQSQLAQLSPESTCCERRVKLLRKLCLGREHATQKIDSFRACIVPKTSDELEWLCHFLYGVRNTFSHGSSLSTLLPILGDESKPPQYGPSLSRFWSQKAKASLHSLLLSDALNVATWIAETECAECAECLHSTPDDLVLPCPHCETKISRSELLLRHITHGRWDLGPLCTSTSLPEPVRNGTATAAGHPSPSDRFRTCNFLSCSCPIEQRRQGVEEATAGGGGAPPQDGHGVGGAAVHQDKVCSSLHSVRPKKVKKLSTAFLMHRILTKAAKLCSVSTHPAPISGCAQRLDKEEAGFLCSQLLVVGALVNCVAGAMLFSQTGLRVEEFCLHLLSDKTLTEIAHSPKTASFALFKSPPSDQPLLRLRFCEIKLNVEFDEHIAGKSEVGLNGCAAKLLVTGQEFVNLRVGVHSECFSVSVGETQEPDCCIDAIGYFHSSQWSESTQTMRGIIFVPLRIDTWCDRSGKCVVVRRVTFSSRTEEPDHTPTCSASLQQMSRALQSRCLWRSTPKGKENTKDVAKIFQTLALASEATSLTQDERCLSLCAGVHIRGEAGSRVEWSIAARKHFNFQRSDKCGTFSFIARINTSHTEKSKKKG